MFSFFKKKPQYPSYQQDPVGFLLWRADEDLRITREVMPQNYAKQKYDLIVGNSDSAIREILTKHALQLRALNNPPEAIIELQMAHEFLDHIECAITKANDKGLILPPDLEGVHEMNFIHSQNLTFAFVATFLLKDWQRAESLAQAMLLPIIQEEGTEGESGSLHDVIPKMFAAVVRGDKPAFEHLEKRFQKGKKNYLFWEKYFTYPELMALILARDSEGINHYLPKQEQSYLQRKTDKKLEGWHLYGCQEDNDRMYDVYASALCNFARYCGLDVTHSSGILLSV
jgi:hypothetical protein